MIVERLSNHLLHLTYNKAIELELDDAFINLLEEEIIKREKNEILVLQKAE